MHVTVCGPADLSLLAPHLDGPSPPSAGYRAPIISRLVLGLVQRGHRVDLVTLSPEPADVGRYRGDDLRVVVGPYRPHRRWADAFRAERAAVAEAVVESGAEVVHAHWTYEFALGALRTGRPVVVSIRDWAPAVFRHRPDHYRAVRLGMQARVLRSSARFTANSPYLAERATRWTRRPVRVIPNGIEFPPDPPPAVAGGPPVVVALANGFGNLKNVATLLEAFPLIRRAHPDALLRLAGSDYQPDGPAARWSADRGLGAGVDFVGPLPAGEVAAFLGGGSVLVHPSFEETFGQVILEAIAAGTPVVAGRDAGAVPWVLDGGASGRLVDVGSPEAIAAAVVSLLDDPAASATLARQAFSDASSRFSLEAMVLGFEEEYEAAIDG